MTSSWGYTSSSSTTGSSSLSLSTSFSSVSSLSLASSILLTSSTKKSSNMGTKRRTRQKTDCTTVGSMHMDQQLQFEADPIVHTIVDHVRPEEEELVWYSRDYLQQVRREEIKTNLRAQYFSKQKVESIESNTLSWRGLEDILEKYNRQDKSQAHVQAVIRKYKALLDTTSTSSSRSTSSSSSSSSSMNKAQATVRKYSKSLSCADRQRAAELGTNDENFVRGVKTVGRRRLSPLGALSKTFRRSSSQPRLPPSSHRSSLVTTPSQ